MFIRWKDTDDVGSDASAGVDNVSISAATMSGSLTLAYVDPNFSASNPAGFDGDLGATGTQSATFNSNAFSSIGAGISAVTAPATIVVNGEPLSPYAETPTLPAGDTLVLTGTPAGTPLTSTVSITGLTLAATTTLASQLTTAVTLNSPITLNGATSVNVTGTGSLTSVGTISGVGSLTTTGTGTVVLQTAESYSGATNVSAGALIVNGSTSATSALTLSAGATLEGSGTVGGTIAASGIVIPGTASTVGTLTAGSTGASSITFATGSTLSVPVLAGGTGELISSGTASIANAVLTLSGSYAGALGSPPFTVLHAATIAGAFSNAAAGTLLTLGTQTFQVSYTSTDVTLTLVPTPSIILGWKAPTATGVLAPTPMFPATTSSTGVLVSPSQQLGVGAGGLEYLLTRQRVALRPFRLLGRIELGRGRHQRRATGISAATAIAGGDYVTFGFTVPIGESVSLTDIKEDARRSGTGPTTGQWQYIVNGGTPTLVASSFSLGSTSSSGVALPTVTLINIPALQNIPAGTNVTFQLLVWGGSGSGGTFYAVGQGITPPTVSGDGLDLEGFVTPTVPTPLEYVDPAFTGSGSVDGDNGSSGSQAAVIGTNAFTSIGTAITTAAGAVPGTIYVNGDGPAGSSYSETPELPIGETMVITGTAPAKVTLSGLTLDTLSTLTSSSLSATLTSPITLNGAPYFNATAPGSLTSIGTISGPGSLTVNGTGTVILQGNETYGGGTTVYSGTLAVNGSTSAVSVISGTLVGTGSVSGAISEQAGIFQPGTATVGGTLTAGSIFLTGGTFSALLSPTDKLIVNGTATLTGGTAAATVLSIGGTYTGAFSTPFNLITAGSVSGNFSNATNGAILMSSAGQSFLVNYTSTAVTLTLIAQEYVDPAFTPPAGGGVDGDPGLTGSQSAIIGTNAFNNIANALTAEAGPLPNFGIVTVSSVGVAGTGPTRRPRSFRPGNSLILSGDPTGGTAPNITLSGLTLDDSTKVTYQGTLAATLNSVITLNGATTVNVTSTAGSLLSNGTISGNGSLTLTGAGTFILNSAESYTGSTSLTAGTLVVNGSTSPSSTVAMSSKTNLNGTGSIGGQIVDISGTIDPGTSTTAATMTAGSLSFFSGGSTVAGGTLSEELLSTGNDELVLTGSASLQAGTLSPDCREHPSLPWPSAAPSPCSVRAASAACSTACRSSTARRRRRSRRPTARSSRRRTVSGLSSSMGRPVRPAS